MNVVYCCDWTEYCAGAEPKYDGVTYALTEFLLMDEIRRRGLLGSPTTAGLAGGYEYSRPSQPFKVIVDPDLVRQIFVAGGVMTFAKEPPGFLGMFNPHDPKANIDLYRSRDERTPDQAAMSAEMTGTS